MYVVRVSRDVHYYDELFIFCIIFFPKGCQFSAGGQTQSQFVRKHGK